MERNETLDDNFLEVTKDKAVLRRPLQHDYRALVLSNGLL